MKVGIDVYNLDAIQNAVFNRKDAAYVIIEVDVTGDRPWMGDDPIRVFNKDGAEIHIS